MTQSAGIVSWQLDLVHRLAAVTWTSRMKADCPFRASGQASIHRGGNYLRWNVAYPNIGYINDRLGEPGCRGGGGYQSTFASMHVFLHAESEITDQ